MLPAFTQRRRFADLSEQEVLALAISAEEDDARIYRSYAERLRTPYPASAAVFDGMAAEEDGHRRRLIDLHDARFGPVIPLIRRDHVAGLLCPQSQSGWRTRRWVWTQMRAEAPAPWRRQAGSLLRNACGRRRPPTAQDAQAFGRSGCGGSRA